jgi:hypothetical protein
VSGAPVLVSLALTFAVVASGPLSVVSVLARPVCSGRVVPSVDEAAALVAGGSSSSTANTGLARQATTRTPTMTPAMTLPAPTPIPRTAPA